MDLTADDFYPFQFSAEDVGACLIRNQTGLLRASQSVPQLLNAANEPETILQMANAEVIHQAAGLKPGDLKSNNSKT